MRIILRVFAPAEGPADARAASQRLRAALKAFAPVEACPPTPYWKVPQWYEHTLDLTPAGPATFDAVVAMVANGWTHLERDTEFSSVWNPGSGSVFVLPETTWAELAFVHKPRAHVIYLRANGVALSREPVGSWRDLQERYDDYMASLGPWTLEEILDHFATQFGADGTAWPIARTAIEEFMTCGRELVLRSKGTS